MSIVCVRCIFFTAIELPDKFFRWSMHSNQESTSTMFFTVLFIDNISGEFVNLINDKIPSPKIEITYAKIYSFNAKAGDDTLKAIRKLHLDIVIYLGHIIFVLLLAFSTLF